MISIPRRVLRDIQTNLNEIENSITEMFPDCIHIDLELDHNTQNSLME
jgi:hypothetical protein